MKGSRHTGTVRSPLPSLTHFIWPLQGLVKTGFRYPTAKWRSFWAPRIIQSMPDFLFISAMFPLVLFFGYYCRNSILKAMMMQQQATQGLFRSPKKRINVKFKTELVFYSIWLTKERIWCKIGLPILAHFQKIPRILKTKQIQKK